MTSSLLLDANLPPSLVGRLATNGVVAVHVSQLELGNASDEAFLDNYRYRSPLHSELLDYIGKVFRARNRTPGAGHGTPGEPDVDRVTAVMLIEFCVALVRIEHQLINET